MIIDAHCHVGTGDLLTAPWTTRAPVEPYLRRARAAGIDKTIVFASFHSDNEQANREVAQIVARHPTRFVGFVFIHVRHDAGRIFELVKKALTLWGFRGIKVHGSEGMPTRELCQVARAFRLPVLVDVMGRASVVEMFASEYREVNFIIPHLGSFTDDWRVHQMVVDQLVRHPNVYADTSGVQRFDYLVQAIQRAGARKILFGSDGPWLHPGLELYKIKLLRLPPEQETLVLGGNALRLIGQARVARQARDVSNPGIAPGAGARPARLPSERGEPGAESFHPEVVL